MEDDPRPMEKPAFSIDLNEAPPTLPRKNPSDQSFEAYSFVLKFHGELTPAEAQAAVFPGEAGVGGALTCGICGKLEVWGGTLVCEGYESGFHAGCLRSRQRQQPLSGVWVCGECALSGPTINEPLPGDEDCDLNRMSNHEEVSPNGVIDEQYSCLNMVQASNGFESANNTAISTGSTQTSSIPNYGLNTGEGFEDLVFGSSVRGRPVLSSVSRSGQFKEELFLNTLRNFVLKKGGFLDEGWHVEFRQTPYGYGPNPLPLYCAPDGKKFESMYDVAHYLGVYSGISPVEVEKRGNGSGSVWRLLAPRERGKDLARTSFVMPTENHDTLKISHMDELCSDTEFIPQNYDIKCASTDAESYMLENGFKESQNLSIGLPLQYEDFFVLCLGKIDARAAYHDSHRIWPIGYRSNWHDKITGSLFLCEVSDGGDSGPVFKVRRRPCSLSVIPNGEIILVHNKARNMDRVERLESSSVIVDCSSNEEEDIVNLLRDPNPSKQEFLSFFVHDGEQSYGSSVQMDIEKPGNPTVDLTSHPLRYVDPSSKSSSMRDVIGEFYVEGGSLSSVWKMVSRTLSDACLEVYKQSGCLQFCCTHQCGSFSLDSENKKGLQHLGSLARFCCASGPIETPRVIRSDIELETALKSVTMWLKQDRFGLDTGFVQEIIENLPASRACSQYRFLVDRNDYSLSCTVGSGLLLAMQKNGERAGEEVSSVLYNGKNGFKLQDLHEDPPLADSWPPPGRPLSNKIPAELVGDVFQIWDFFWRFYEILGLKEPLSFEELEGELIAPWPCDLNHLKKIEKENQDSNELETDSADCSVPLAAGASDTTTHEHSPLNLIPVETAAMWEATQVKVASRTFRSCSGVTLTKAHISLLKVLVGELLNKAAAFLNPNFDSRDLKSKRGRKKDTGISYPPKEPKKELSSVNELTWPELAHRYVLAVLSMNSCAKDVSARESLKVYRCLQGDGGVLCGSLSGVAGMEADALLLAEAERPICCTTKQNSDVLPVKKDSDAVATCQPAVVTSNNLPEWAQPLEHVRKLPTNVGARIRKCVYNSLEKNPPEWAKEILKHSISKEVYKGNASGPTKKAVLSILAKLCGGSHLQKPAKAPRKKIPLFASDAIMKKCRIVLRSAVSADELRRFCNLLGTTFLNSTENNERGILGSPAMVSRPLDFRTIDLRLAVGAYYGCHEAFLEDVREWCLTPQVDIPHGM